MISRRFIAGNDARLFLKLSDPVKSGAVGDVNRSGDVGDVGDWDVDLDRLLLGWRIFEIIEGISGPLAD